MEEVNYINNKKINLIFTLLECLLSFSIPFILLVIIFATNGFTPFKENGVTLISIDLQSQYITYLRTYKQILCGNQSLIYTQTKVFGGDFMSIFTYYLASPFNLFLVFCPDKSIPEFILFISIIKLSFASLNFYLLSRYLYKGKKLVNIIFGISYGLISYSLMYMSNFMWLDGIMILPLTILGLHFIKDNKHLWLYPLSLFYCLMTSWYIGFIICLFLIIFFLYLFISSEENFKAKLPFLIRFCLFSIIGGMLSGVFFICAFTHFNGTKASTSLPSVYLFSISTFFSGFLQNSYTTVRVIEQNTGYISMFTGVVSLVFALRYFLNKSFTLRQRLTSLGVVICFFLIASVSTLNALFHGGREPTWFPSRYSFIIGFFTCYLASQEISNYKSSPKYSFILPLIIMAIVIPIVLYIPNSNNLEEMFKYYNLSIPSLIIFIVVSLVSGIYPFIKDIKFVNKHSFIFESVFAIIFLSLSCYSSYLGANNIISQNKSLNQYQSKQTYLTDLSYSPVFDAIKEYDSSQTYRMEGLFNRPGNYNNINNNPMFYSYNGLNHFSSSEKKTVEEYFYKIGFHYNGYFERYDGGSTCSINSLLNMKYLIDIGDLSSSNPVFYKNTSLLNPWQKIDLTNSSPYQTSYYQNTKAISYGFIIDDNSSYYISEGRYKENGDIYWYDHFEYQNEIFKTLVSNIVDENGDKKDIFHPIKLNLEESSKYTYTIDDDGFYHFTIKAGNSITFNFSTKECIGNNFYFNTKDEDSRIYSYIDNSRMENNTYWHKNIRGFKDNSTNYHTLRLYITEDLNDHIIRPEVYYEDLSIMNQYLDKLSSSMLKDVTFNQSLLSYSYKGKINITSETKDKTLLFTFPNQKGISIKIDGKKYDVITRLNIFSAVDFSNLEEGEHSIEFSYSDSGLIIGGCVSIGFAILFILTLIYYPTIEKKYITKSKK